MIQRRLEQFVKNLPCYDCPSCWDPFDVQIGMIQKCGHIHCEMCFSISEKCSCCRAISIKEECKSVVSHLSDSELKIYFMRQSPEKKSAIAVLSATIKRQIDATKAP